MDSKQAESRIEIILANHGKGPGQLVPVLLDIQENFGYLPQEIINRIALFLEIPVGHIYSVASFYTRFQLKPVGRRRVTVCRGTACHIRGAPQIVSEIEKSLNLKEGKTSSDLEYTLETVACIGCCALAPCLKVNETVYGALTPRKANALFSELTQERKNAG